MKHLGVIRYIIQFQHVFKCINKTIPYILNYICKRIKRIKNQDIHFCKLSRLMSIDSN